MITDFWKILNNHTKYLYTVFTLIIQINYSKLLLKYFPNDILFGNSKY